MQLIIVAIFINVVKNFSEPLVGIENTLAHNTTDLSSVQTF